MRFLLGFTLVCAALAASASAQQPAPASGQTSGQTLAQSSSSSSGAGAPVQHNAAAVHPGAGLEEAGGASITLQTSEALFDLAVALNACGYDADLANSSPIRTAVRQEVAAAIAQSPQAGAAAAAVCSYIRDHELNDKGRELAQYVSLGLYLTPPPALTTIADQTEMPPDALQVVNILPQLRDFETQTHLHSIWLKHRPEYEALRERLHDPVTALVTNTDIYLKLPLSSYQDRRLLILVEPMLAPNAPNARIYANDYVIVTSPDAAGAVRMDQIRHLYLHYTIEPLIYARANSMLRLTPLLRPVANAPVEYVYKTDVVALVTECMIKAIEARTMETGLIQPRKPDSKARQDEARYDEEMSTYEREAEQTRRKQVELDMREGWTLTQFFYEELIQLEHLPEGLDEYMGQMVYGMDVDRERHRDEQIAFLPVGSGEYVRRAPRIPTGLMLAEKKMLEGDLDGASEIADKALADPRQDHAQAMYVKARVELLEGDPETSLNDFRDVLKTAKDPHTQAWAHIYLGRLYDTKEPAERSAALAEYKAALNIPGVPQDARAAAGKGLQTPFSVPKLKHEGEEPLDPSGKAEKQSYKPDQP
jgi:hypothetical protein